VGRFGGALVGPAAFAVRALAVALAVLAFAEPARRSLQITPHAVYLDQRIRAAQVTLANTGTSAEDVVVELKFGYPDTDSLGDLFIRLVDAPAPDAPSSAAWTTVYPRHVVVPAGGRQVVRLLAQPPADLPAGEYWARLLVTTRPAADSLDAAPLVTTIAAVTYRNGAVRTGVSLSGLRAAVEHDSLVVRADLAREGNAAWLGTGTVRLFDGAGRMRAQWAAPTAVYYRLARRLAFPLAVPSGRYRVQMTLVAVRSDVPARVVLAAAPAEATTDLEVPAARP
jgi:hypothetical protein